MNVPRPLLKQAVASLLFISAVFAVAIPVLYLVHRPLKPPIAAGAWFASCVTTFLISSERRDLAQFFINSLGWLPFAVACITFPLWYWTASHLNSIQGAFFEVGAQVI